MNETQENIERNIELLNQDTSKKEEVENEIVQYKQTIETLTQDLTVFFLFFDLIL